MTEEILRRIDDERMKDFRARMNQQDQILFEIRDRTVAQAENMKVQAQALTAFNAALAEYKEALTKHIAEENRIAPALDELVSLWKGSKILIPTIGTLGVAIGWVISWLKDHNIFR